MPHRLLGFNLPGRFGFGRTLCLEAPVWGSWLFQSARQIWVWPNAWRIKPGECATGFQSARQIWVWPNTSSCSACTFARSVSICQADLGLAELHVQHRARSAYGSFNLPGRFGFGRTSSSSARSAAIVTFQSARQIWVWPNSIMPAAICDGTACFNLPGRFGFGRTGPRYVPELQVPLFQSARQIWVWPNATF